MIHAILTLLLALPDLITKSWIESRPDNFFPHSLKHVPLTLDRHHNYGFSRNRLQDHPNVVRWAVAVFFGSFSAMAFRGPLRSRSRAERVGILLILGGGLSNLIDRLTRGYVVDYLHFQLPKLNRVIMNIGDIFLFLGSIIASFGMITEE